MQFFRKLSLNHKGFSYKNSNTKKRNESREIKKEFEKSSNYMYSIISSRPNRRSVSLFGIPASVQPRNS